MCKEQEPKILIDIYNLLIDIRNILIKVHKSEVCPHVKLEEKVEYWTVTSSGENYTVHRCLGCGQLINVPEKKEKEEVKDGSE